METEYSVDEVFGCVVDKIRGRTHADLADKLNSEALKMVAGATSYCILLFVREENAVTCVQYRKLTFPWYV